MSEQIYEEQDQSGGMTLKSVISFLKLSAVRVLIYVLCALVAAAAVLGGWWLFGSKTEITAATLELSYDGADRGLAPDGKVFNSNDIRSVNVLRNAVARVSLSSKVPDLYALQGIIAIDGVESAEYVTLKKQAEEGNTAAQDKLRNTNYYSTRFDVKITDATNLGLTREETRSLLNSILDAYRDTFRQDQAKLKFTTDIYNLTENSAASEFYDYSDYYDSYSVKLSTITAGLRGLANMSDFQSDKTGASFNSLLESGAIISGQYGKYIDTVLSSGASKNVEEAKKNINRAVANLNITLTKLSEDARLLGEQLKNYPPNILIQQDSTGKPVELKEYPKEYHALQQQLTNINQQITATQEQIDLYGNRLTELANFGTTDEAVKTRIEDMLTFISEESIAYVNQVNAFLDDYYDNKYVDAVRTAIPAANITLRGDIPTLIIILGFALAGAVIALLVTYIKRNNGKKSKPQSIKPVEKPTEINQ